MKKEGKNSPKLAAAIRYNIGEDAVPKIVATGRGAMADKIEEIARQENIPIHRDKVLAQMLAELGAGVEIPPELYQAVAKILVQVAQLDREIANKK